MTPVKQTKFSTESENGNCMAAALASVLDLPLDSVPAFEEMQGVWKTVFLEWLAERGLTVKTQTFPPDGLAIATGPSERGVHHAVVVNSGQFLHDPHPSNCFLTCIGKYWVISDLTAD